MKAWIDRGSDDEAIVVLAVAIDGRHELLDMTHQSIHWEPELRNRRRSQLRPRLNRRPLDPLGEIVERRCSAGESTNASAAQDCFQLVELDAHQPDLFNRGTDGRQREGEVEFVRADDDRIGRAFDCGGRGDDDKIAGRGSAKIGWLIPCADRREREARVVVGPLDVEHMQSVERRCDAGRRMATEVLASAGGNAPLARAASTVTTSGWSPPGSAPGPAVDGTDDGGVRVGMPRHCGGRRMFAMRRNLLSLSGWDYPSERKAVIDAQATIVAALLDVARRSTDAALHREVRHMISRAMWSVTEIHASRFKYDQRYISEGVHDLIDASRLRNEPLPIRVLRHEHVQPRKVIAERLLGLPAATWHSVRPILEEAEACIVTKDEDSRLERLGNGWQRYSDAGIRVWDRCTGHWKELPAARKPTMVLPPSSAVPAPSAGDDGDGEDRDIVFARVAAIMVARGMRARGDDGTSITFRSGVTGFDYNAGYARGRLRAQLRTKPNRWTPTLLRDLENIAQRRGAAFEYELERNDKGARAALYTADRGNVDETVTWMTESLSKLRDVYDAHLSPDGLVP